MLIVIVLMHLEIKVSYINLNGFDFSNDKHKQKRTQYKC